MPEVVARVRSASERETERLGGAFGRLLRPGDVVVLQGELGAGKTAFARGAAAGLGADPGEVQSPTFTIVRVYQGAAFPIHHLDIYRLESPEDELEAIGCDEYFDPREGVSLVEWGEKAGRLLPESRFDVLLRSAGSVREIEIVARGGLRRRTNELREALAREVQAMEAERSDSP